MASVLILTPYTHERRGVFPPYGVILIATILKKAGHQVRIFDMGREIIRFKDNEADCLTGMADVISAMRPDIVGISFFTHFLPEAGVIMHHAREHCRKIGIKPIFVAGGIHPTMEPEQTLRDIDVDYVCIGDGEDVLLALAEGDTPDDIPGLASMKRLSLSPAKRIEDLDSLPFTDYNLCDWRFYVRKEQCLYLFMSRGCAYSCNFCAYITHNPLRFHSADYVVENMRYIERSFGIRKFFFYDSSLGSNWKLLEEFCEKLLVDPSCSEWQWQASMRVDQIDKYRLKLMKRAGCTLIKYGFESGSQDDLNRMNKKVTVADNYRAVALTRDAGIPFSASVLVNYPGQTTSDLKATEEMLFSVLPFGRIAINAYAPLPGSRDYGRFSRIFNATEREGGGGGKCDCDFGHIWNVSYLCRYGYVYSDAVA